MQSTDATVTVQQWTVTLKGPQGKWELGLGEMGLEDV